jgi:hypothetical protein
VVVIRVLSLVMLACGLARAEPVAFPPAKDLPAEPVTKPWTTQADITHRRFELFSNVTYLGWVIGEDDNYYNASLRIGPGYYRRSQSVFGIYPSYQIDRVSKSTVGLNVMTMWHHHYGGYLGGFVDASSGKLGGLVSACAQLNRSREEDQSNTRGCLEVQVRDTDDGLVVAVALTGGIDIVGLARLFGHILGRD